MAAVRRLRNGYWAPGHSGNPRGRPKVTPEQREALRLLAEGTVKAAKKLLRLVDSEDERVALAAVQAVLSRLPVQPDDVDCGPGDGELSEQLRRLADRLGGRAA